MVLLQGVPPAVALMNAAAFLLLALSLGLRSGYSLGAVLLLALGLAAWPGVLAGRVRWSLPLAAWAGCGGWSLLLSCTSAGADAAGDADVAVFAGALAAAAAEASVSSGAGAPPVSAGVPTPMYSTCTASPASRASGGASPIAT